jgi:predicted aspartyl protease
MVLGAPAFFGVDTGCHTTILKPHAAAVLGVDVSHPVRHDILTGLGTSGPVPAVTIGQVNLGGYQISNVLAYVYEIPAALRVSGLLGLNALRRFRVTFEFDTDTLVLRSLS